MNDTSFEKQIESGDLELVRLGVEHTRLRTKQLQYLTVFLVCLIVVMALAIVLFNRFDTNSQLNATYKQVTDLSAQLTETQTDLSEARQVRNDVDLCQSKFDKSVSNAARESNVGETELVILIATVQPEDREAVIGSKVQDLRAAAATYRQAGQDRSNWVDAGKPLPCPI